ncbi:MAG: sugar phosphate isomerase/epimerase [Ruminococcaceae bacterium]|nr:sugar phosphate isomerase/epimerase [Oscillospiraceae bacterium]
MILSSSSNTLVRNFGYFGAIDIMKEADYDAIDLSLFTMTEDDNEFCTDGYRARIAEIRAYAEQKGIFFNQSHTPFRFNWANPNEVEERLIPRTIRALEVSALAGCKIAVVHPVHHEEYLGHEEERFEENMKYYRGLLPYAKEYGIKIALENMFQREVKRKTLGHDTCSQASEFIRYLDTLDDEHFVACLDLGHCGVVGSEAQDLIRALGHDRLHALHVHDNDYTKDQHTLPGLGKMNWEEIMKALAEIDYDGEFTFEADRFFMGLPPALMPKAVSLMVDMGRYLIGRFEAYQKIGRK